jgi:hydrogenase-4 component F
LIIGVAIFQLALSLAMLAAPSTTYPVEFSLHLGITVDFRIDAVSLYFILLVNVVAFAASWNTWAYLEKAPPGPGLQHPAFFQGSVNGFHLTMLLVPMLDNLIALWIAIELTTLFSAFLVGHRNTKDAWEAAWKYLVITSAGIILALLGTMLLANAVTRSLTAVGTEITDPLMNWSVVMDLARQGRFNDAISSNLFTLSFLFILVGYGTKAGLAPMHTWLPDGHGEAPAPISALLSGVLLKSALYAILRFYTITNTVRHDEGRFTSAALLGTGLLSLILAVPFILKPNRFKRVLAYHSLEHMGIITFGIGLGGSVALFGALLHCLNHAVTKALMFLSFGNLTRAYQHLLDREPREDEVTGALQVMPKTAVLLALGGLALVGMPPFSVFMSEMVILWGALGALLGAKPPGDYTDFPAPVVIVAVILFLISTTLIFYGLVRHLGRIVLHQPPAVATGQAVWRERWGRDLLPLLLLALLMLALGLWIAPPLADLISRSAAIVLDTTY